MQEKVKLILGTMTFGEQIFGRDTEDMSGAFRPRVPGAGHCLCL